MSKNIIRPKKRKNPYVMLDKECLNNKSLSFRAKGLHAYLISKPDNWVVMMTELVSSAVEGRDAIRKAFKELEDTGYIVREPKRGSNGKLKGTATIIHERATDSLKTRSSVDADNQEADKPSDGETPPTNKVKIPITEEKESVSEEHKSPKPKPEQPPPTSPAPEKFSAVEYAEIYEREVQGVFSYAKGSKVLKQLQAMHGREKTLAGWEAHCKDLTIREWTSASYFAKYPLRWIPQAPVKDAFTLPQEEHIWK